jgi:hypothetical protein
VDGRRVLRAIDARDPKADRVGTHIAIANCGIHHMMQHFLDLELAGRLEIRAAAARFPDHIALPVGKQADGLGAARVYSEHVHLSKIVVQSAAFHGRTSTCARVPRAHATCSSNLPSDCRERRADRPASPRRRA